jgi:hypothetical protein
MALTRPDVPIWRAWQLSFADVLCARSVRVARALIGRHVWGFRTCSQEFAVVSAV